MLIKIGKRTYVMGLAWRTFTSKPSKEEITETAQLYGAQYYCDHPLDFNEEVGFASEATLSEWLGSTPSVNRFDSDATTSSSSSVNPLAAKDQPESDVRRSGPQRLFNAIRRVKSSNRKSTGTPKKSQKTTNTKIYSLAAALADTEAFPWAATFRLSEDTYWYIAVREEHSLVADGDVIGSYDAVQEAKQKHQGLADWTYVDGNIGDIEHLLAKSARAPAAIKPLVRSYKPLIRAAVISAILFAIGMGAWSWYQYQQAAIEKQAQLTREQSTQLERQKMIATRQSHNTPSASAWLGQCALQAGDMAMDYLGWKLSKLACNATGLTVTYMASATSFLQHLPPGQLSTNEQSVVQTIAFNKELMQQIAPPQNAVIALAPVAQPYEGSTRAQSEILLKDYVKYLGATLELKTEPAPPSASPSSAMDTLHAMSSFASGPAAPLPRVDHFLITLPKGLNPFSLHVELTPLVKVTSVTTDDLLTQWQIAGNLYEQY